jgi:hypothetical protein
MGHEGTPVDVRMVSHVVIVKPWASRGICAWFLEAKWLKHQVRITKTTPGPFCDFPRLWHTPSYKFSALQRWRQWKPLIEGSARCWTITLPPEQAKAC